MRILWVTNIPMPGASLALGRRPEHVGGWMTSIAETLQQHADVEMVFAFPERSVQQLTELSDGLNRHFAFPARTRGSTQAQQIDALKRLIHMVCPDLIHLHGTEFPHSSALIKCRPRTPVVVSIQGLVSIIADHYFSGLPPWAIKAHTLRTLIKRDNVEQSAKRFARLGLQENLVLSSVRHVIGRTNWDRACTLRINPQAEYHYVPESLRERFYQERWDLEACQRHSLLVSQGSYPIKGFHQVLKALVDLAARFDDVHLYVAGTPPFQGGSWAQRLRENSYAAYLRKLTRQLKLENRLTFLGPLNEEEMSNWFSKCHVFVSASSVENESNSVGEALLLGVPCVASYVGGVIDRVGHGEDGFLYPADAPYMMAYWIGKIFEDDPLARSLSQKARSRAQVFYDKSKNVDTLLSVYRRILAT